MILEVVVGGDAREGNQSESRHRFGEDPSIYKGGASRGGAKKKRDSKTARKSYGGNKRLDIPRSLHLRNLAKTKRPTLRCDL